MIAGCKAEAVVAARSALDFMYRAHMPELSDEDLDLMEDDLSMFHDSKSTFVGGKALPNEERFNGIPKIHMMSHYTHAIRELGTTDGYNTEATERLHIDYVKEGWRASNHVNATAQMTTYLQRKESWALLRAHMRERGLLPKSMQALDEVGDGGNEDDEDDDDYDDGNDGDGDGDGEGEGNGEKDVWYPNPRITTAKRPGIGKVTGRHLVDKHHAADLIPATRRFITQQPDAPTSFPLSEESFFSLWSRAKLVHKRLPFLPSAPPQEDKIRALPSSHDDEGRLTRFGAFDVVLFSPPSQTGNPHGLRRTSPLFHCVFFG
jgi:hypothetical protein